MKFVLPWRSRPHRRAGAPFAEADGDLLAQGAFAFATYSRSSRADPMRNRTETAILQSSPSPSKAHRFSTSNKANRNTVRTFGK